MRPDETPSRGHGEKRSRQTDRFIAALLTHGSLEGASQALGIAASTGKRWWADAAVRERFAEANRDLMRAVTQHLLTFTRQVQAAALGSVETLIGLRDGAESEQVRGWAAGRLLDLSLKAVDLSKRVGEMIDLQERQNRLEQKLADFERQQLWKGSEDDHQPDRAPDGPVRGPDGRVNGRG